MPTDLPPLPPPGALPPMPTDLPPLPPPTEHLPIPPAMLGDEIRNQARSVVQQVMQLNQIIHEQNEEVTRASFSSLSVCFAVRCGRAHLRN
jgi:hypothetical protein